MSGSKPAWALRDPVAESVASVRPCHAFSITMMLGFSTPRWWPCRRASLIAASLASAPELQKKALSIPAIAQTFAAARSCSGTWKRLDVWMSLPTCSRKRLREDRMVVPQAIYRDAGEAVEVALALRIPQPRAFAAREGHGLRGVGLHQVRRAHVRSPK